MPIAVTSQCRRRGVRATSVRTDAARLLRERKVDAELSIVLVDDAAIQALNATYRNKNQPTDVLAFSMREGEAAPRRDLLGDVVISVETAARQATERGVSVAAEVRTLLTHGILHLLGYDHERSAADARGMFALQDRLVCLLEREDSK
jgi:probable rRNA maturation factor